MRTVSLWWSLLWRSTLLLNLLIFVLEPVAKWLLIDAEPVAAVKYRPTVAWTMVAALFWASGAASARFVRAVLWGERLRLADSNWLTYCRAIAVLYALLAVANVVIANTASTETWVNFKLFT